MWFQALEKENQTTLSFQTIATGGGKKLEGGGKDEAGGGGEGEIPRGCGPFCEKGEMDPIGCAKEKEP